MSCAAATLGRASRAPTTTAPATPVFLRNVRRSRLIDSSLPDEVTGTITEVRGRRHYAPRRRPLVRPGAAVARTRAPNISLTNICYCPTNLIGLAPAQRRAP